LPGVDVVTLTSNSGTSWMSFVAKAWAASTVGAKPPALWQPPHPESSACGKPAWSTPVVQSIVSWQEPQEARERTVFQLSTSSPVPVWQASQFSRLAGNAAERQVAPMSPTV
jgi:hypothetical protein